MTVDLSTTIIPKSDQLNAEDFLSGPQTFTVREVRRGGAEQPIDIMLEETDRAYRPSKTMRRVLVIAWGSEGAVYAGRKFTLYRDPEVKFGAEKVGGIKISHLSHIDRPLSMSLTATRGKRAQHTVEPLIPEAVGVEVSEPTPQQVADCTDVAVLTAWLPVSRPVVRDRINARVNQLQNGTTNAHQ